MKIIAFFNSTSGVGKTSLVYHVAWMLSEFGYRVIAADLDPQANLTSLFLDEDAVEALWDGQDKCNTVYRMVTELVGAAEDVRDPACYAITDNLALLPGDIELSKFEEQLSIAWAKCLAGDMRAFSVLSAFYRLFSRAADVHSADVVLVDIGSNLSAINRAALFASDRIVLPVAADLFALRGLISLGSQLRAWREDWRTRLDALSPTQAHPSLPKGSMPLVGYIATQHAIHQSRPIRRYERSIMMRRIPAAYREYVLGEPSSDVPEILGDDEHCLAVLKNYRSLMILAQEARKPMFHLTAADGALGTHRYAVLDCFRQFQALNGEIIRRCGIFQRRS